MKLCSKHYANLVAQVKRKGMWKLVSTSDAETEVRMARWKAGIAGIDEMDPLGVALAEIYLKAYNVVGPSTNHPDTCALCAVEAHFQAESASEEWIDNCTDAILAVCIANNLLTQKILHH